MTRIIKDCKAKAISLSRTNHVALNQQRFYKTYIFKLLIYSLKAFPVSFANSVKRKFKEKIFISCFSILKSLAVILGSSIKWKRKGKIFYSLSNAFLILRGQLDRFFFSLRITLIIIFLDIIVVSFTKKKKNKNKYVLRRF